VELRFDSHCVTSLGVKERLYSLFLPSHYETTRTKAEKGENDVAECQVIEILSYSWECQYIYARKIIKWYHSILSPALKVKDTIWNNFASAFTNKEIHSLY